MTCSIPSNSSQNKNPKQRPFCENGVHNPNTTHTPDQCHQLHPKLAIAYLQAALTRIQNKTNAGKANLSFEKANPNLIILDSGALGHFLKHQEYFLSLTPTDSFLYTANGTPLKVIGFGPAIIPLESGVLEIPHAQLVPELSNSLIAMAPYLQSGYSINPTNNGFKCIKDGSRLMTGKILDNVLALNIPKSRAFSAWSSLDLHRSLGHPNDSFL